MSALMRSSRFLKSAALARPAVGNQTVAPALTRCLSEEDKKRRDLYREKMQYPDHTPVYLRGGSSDMILLGITYVLVGVGLCHTGWRLWARLQAS